METRNNYGFPSMICDYCNQPITNDHGMAIDNGLSYHANCWYKLVKEYPDIYKEKGGDNLPAVG